MPTREEIRQQMKDAQAKLEQDFASRGLVFDPASGGFRQDPSYSTPQENVSLQKGLQALEYESQANPYQLDKIKSEAERARLQLEEARNPQAATKSGGREITSGMAETEGASRAALLALADLKALLARKTLDTGGSQKTKGFLRDKLGLGESVVKTNNDELDFYTTAELVAAQYRKVLSGTGVSDKEVERTVRGFLPQITDTRQRIQAKIKGMEKDILRRTQGTKDVYTKGLDSPIVDPVPKAEDFRRKYNY